MTLSRLTAVTAACVVALVLAGPAGLQAQAPVPSAGNQPAAAGQAPPLVRDAHEIRADLQALLQNHPPALGRVLWLDPGLMTNSDYLAPYPQLAAFVAQHPEVPRNAAFYLDRYGEDLGQPRDATERAFALWEDVLGFAGAFAVLTATAFALYAMLRYVVEYRRWLKISKTHTEVHNKLLDRFGSNAELLAYIESPAGRRFLEAAPLTASPAVQGRPAAPYARILLSVQIGVILLGLSLGLMWISGRAVIEVREVFMGLSVLGFTLGLGCIVSAAASYVLSRKLGLLPDAPERPAELV